MPQKAPQIEGTINGLVRLANFKSAFDFGRLARRPNIAFLLVLLLRLCVLGALQGAQKRSRNLLGVASVSLGRLLELFAGPDFGLQIHVQQGFLQFGEFAAYLAVVYWPAPHSWNSMQFCELYSMSIPLFYPSAEDP